jgi:hypothetical protein
MRHAERMIAAAQTQAQVASIRSDANQQAAAMVAATARAMVSDIREELEEEKQADKPTQQQFMQQMQQMQQMMMTMMTMTQQQQQIQLQLGQQQAIVPSAAAPVVMPAVPQMVTAAAPAAVMQQQQWDHIMDDGDDDLMHQQDQQQQQQQQEQQQEHQQEQEQQAAKPRSNADTANVVAKEIVKEIVGLGRKEDLAQVLRGHISDSCILSLLPGFDHLFKQAKAMAGMNKREQVSATSGLVKMILNLLEGRHVLEGIRSSAGAGRSHRTRGVAMGAKQQTQYQQQAQVTTRSGRVATKMW